jgi:hypothetical protein
MENEFESPVHPLLDTETVLEVPKSQLQPDGTVYVQFPAASEVTLSLDVPSPMVKDEEAVEDPEIVGVLLLTVDPSDGLEILA